MKKINLLKTMLLAAIMLPSAASAQPDFGTDDVVNTTTLWTFDQYQGGETVAKGELINYQGLYLHGHGTNEMLINRLSRETISSFGGQDVTVYNALRSKAGREAAGTKASAINNATIAFNAGVAGTVYVYARVENAAKKMTIAFNGTKVVDEAIADASAYNVYSYTCTEAGCIAIAGTGAYQIKAVKFVPTTDPEATVNVTMSDVGIMTFSSVHALTLSGNLKAYRLGKTTIGSKISATEITGAIPAGTGVILTGTPNQVYTLTITDAAATARDINYSLRPVVIDYALPATYSTGDADNKNWDNYIMVKDGDKVVFKKSTGTGNIAAGKAYYSIRRDQSKPAEAPVLTLNFDNNTTGISEIEGMRNVGNEMFFDLQGRRVDQPTKGMYIVNGKKVIIK